MERDQAAQHRKRHDSENERSLTEGAAADCQEDEHQSHHHSGDHEQPCLGAPLILKLAAPFEANLRRIEVHLCGDLRFRFFEVRGQVAVAISPWRRRCGQTDFFCCAKPV
jgi:hypothetical protein